MFMKKREQIYCAGSGSAWDHFIVQQLAKLCPDFSLKPKLDSLTRKRERQNLDKTIVIRSLWEYKGTKDHGTSSLLKYLP